MEGNQELSTTPVVEPETPAVTEAATPVAEAVAEAAAPAVEAAATAAPAATTAPAQPNQQYAGWNMDLQPMNPNYPGNVQQPVYQQPVYQQPMPGYQQPVYQAPGFSVPANYQTAGPMKHAGSLIVLIAGGMAAFQFIFCLLATVARVRYMGARWISISQLIVFGSAFIPIAVELLVTGITAKRENKNPSRAGLIVGLIAGIIHLVISFVALILIFLSAVGVRQIARGLTRTMSSLNLPVSDRFFLQYGYTTIFLVLLFFTITWIIMHFALNNTRINMMRRIQGRRFSLNPIFPAVMLFINAVPFLAFVIIYCGNSLRHLRSFQAIFNNLGIILMYAFMPIVLILCGVALIGLKKDK